MEFKLHRGFLFYIRFSRGSVEVQSRFSLGSVVVCSKFGRGSAKIGSRFGQGSTEVEVWSRFGFELWFEVQKGFCIGL